MIPVRASAPGKVVVCGEYAVLDGAPAIVMAVDRRAVARVAPEDGDWHRAVFAGPQDDACEFRMDAAGRAAPRGGGEPPRSLALVASVWKAVAAKPAGPVRLDLDTRPFFHAASGRKLGLGSSAALTAALTQAWLRATGDRRDAGEPSFAAHRDFQGGRGSGVDVAAALRGGLIAYRQADASATARLCWPPGLRHALLWSGRPADTASRVRAFAEAPRGAAARLGRAAEDVLGAWQAGESCGILDAMKAYARELESFGTRLDLGIFDAGHDRLASLARSRGVAYKPCGAGGGDVGIVVADREDTLEDFVGGAERLGFERLCIEADARGVEVSA